MNMKKDYIWNPSACSCENEKYLASIMDDSAFTRKQPVKRKIFERTQKDLSGAIKCFAQTVTNFLLSSA